MRWYRTTLAVIALMILAASRIQAQDQGFEFVKATNGVISVAVEKTTGQFRIESPYGLPLLFSASGGLTAYTNVRYATNTYTTNLWNRTAPPVGMHALPLRSIEALPDRVRLISVLRDGRDSLVLQLDFIPSLDGDFAYVDVVALFRNDGRRPVEVGLLHVYDVMLGSDDNPEFRADQQLISSETGWTDISVPGLIEASSPSSPYRMRFRTGAASATMPDALVLGNWQHNGYLGTVSWDYQPSGLPLIDGAVLLSWDTIPLGAGAQRRIGVEYGFLLLTDVALTCSTEDVSVTSDSSAYLPNPLPVRAMVTNTGIVPLQNLRLRLTTAHPLTLSTGETAEKDIPGTLPPGGQALVTWLLDIDAVQTLTSAGIDISIISPDTLQRTCTLNVDIPPLRMPTAAVECGDTIRLGLSQNGTGYAPDPFALRVIVINAGTTPMRNMSATIQLPPELVLAGGLPTLPVVPDPLLSGQKTVVSWPLRGIAQPADVVVRCAIIIQSDGNTVAECEAFVQLPEINTTPCIDQRATTAGTEFYLGFLPDNVGSGTELLRLYLTAPEGANVVIEQLSDGHLTHVTIPQGAMGVQDLDTRLNDFAAEVVIKAGVRITSDRPIHAFAINLRERHSDGLAVLPAHALGTDYLTVGYNWEGAFEQFLVLATEDGTTATVIPHAFTSSGLPDGQPIVVSLDRGDVYCIKSRFAGGGGSLTGSRILSDKPVAVFSGGESGWIPDFSTPAVGFLNPHAEQMIPVEFLGMEYAAMPFRSRQRGDTYRIVAAQAGTSVTIGAGPAIPLTNAGDWYETILDRPQVIVADKPVLVAQFANSARWDSDTSEYGDGSMLLHVPLDRHASCHYFPAGMLVADPVLEPNQAAFVDYGSWLLIPDNPVTALRSFTLECWAQTISTGSIMSRWSSVSSEDGWMLRFDDSRNRLILTISSGGQTVDFPSPDNLITRRMWAHIALSIDIDAGSARVTVGGLAAIVASFTPMTAVNGSWNIGGSADGGAWTGYLDECRLWRGMRGVGDIQNLMFRRIKPLEMGDLVGYWGFCAAWSDESGLGNNISPSFGSTLFGAWDLPVDLRCSEVVDSSFVNIVAPAGATDDVRLNHRPVDAGEWSDLPWINGWRIATLHVPGGLNRLETSDPRGIGISSYGFAYHDAYTAFTGFGAWRGTTSVSPPARLSKAELHAPWPNPARGGDVHASFTLPTPARTSIRLIDASGRIIRVLLDVECPAATTRLRIPTQGLSAGTYRIVLRYGQKNLVRTFVLLE